MELTTPTVTDVDTDEAQLVPKAVWAQRGQSWAESWSVGLQRRWPPAPTPHHSRWPGSPALMLRSLRERKETAATASRFLSQPLFWQNEPVWTEVLGEKPLDGFISLFLTSLF